MILPTQRREAPNGVAVDPPRMEIHKGPQAGKQDKDLQEPIGEAAIVNALEGLHGMRFPAKRVDLIRKAKENDADESVLQELERLDQDHLYNTPRDLMDALHRETRGL